MEKEIKDRYNQAILEEAMRLYGIEVGRIHLLDGFESFIYEFETGDCAYILRVAHSIRRNVNLIHGEVDWINYLSAGGAPVAKAIRSDLGRLVEVVDDGVGGQFLLTSFIKARGETPTKENMTPNFFENYGRLLGRMHSLSKRYRLRNIEWRRPRWNDPIMLEVEKYLPESDTLIGQRFRELMDHLHKLPKDKDSYGLIHQDAHAGNLFVDKAGAITLFDFDDCAYSWFMNDIAIVLFYAAMWEEEAGGFTEEFMRSFLQGYMSENRLDPGWLKEIPYFLKLREIDLYAVIHRSFDMENLDDPWCVGYMNGRKERIEENVPYIDFDFESLAGYF